ncbi:hypothetical protein J3R82DRAFT_3522 [Butyriboletus roseoflavus]|nr:hypothetical protein J3R82DRAFT_3522 [Butyriboletus roseoflavus]
MENEQLDETTYIEKGQFDVADTPEELQTDDAVRQVDVEHALALDDFADSTKNQVTSFHRTAVTNVRLSQLRQEFEQKRDRTATMRLRKRSRVLIDDEFLLDRNDPQLAWGANKHFLDYFLLVAGKKGLHAVLPTTIADPSYSFKLDLHQRHRPWRARHSELGFDPAGRLLYIGSYHQEEIWLAMVPRTFTHEDDGDDFDDIVNEECNMQHINQPTTALSESHYCMLVYFLAKSLQACGFKDIYTLQDYPSPLKVDNIRNETNILGYTVHDKTVHELKFNDVRHLHEQIDDQYDAFVLDATEEWKADGFLNDNVPITISVRYGQNQDICGRDTEEEEGYHWHRLHNYRHIRTMAVALATHIECYTAEDWETIDFETLLDKHGDDIYDSPEAAERRWVDLRTYDLLDDEGKERNVYDSLGYRISRRKVNLPQDAQSAGIFFNLKDLHALFENPYANTNAEAVTPHYLYPIAGLRNVGQFQADGAFYCFTPLLRSLNHSLARHDDDDDDDDDQVHHPGPYIRSIFSQGYNASAHRVRTQSRFHDVQRGMLTAAFAGNYASSASNKRKAAELFDLCATSLPFERYNTKVSNSTFDQSLRMENVYVIDLFRLPLAQRNGRVVYRSIVRPLTRMWSHPSVLEQVKDHVKIFKPNILPHIVQWTSYGLCSILGSLYERFKTNLQERIKIEPYWVELIGALERTLNFCHTGNAKVLTRGVMDPTWLSLSCVLDGLPALSNIVPLRYTPHITVDISRNDWPLSKKTGQPLMTSQRSFQLNYGLEEMAAYVAIFHIKHSIRTLPPSFACGEPDYDIRLSLYLLDRALQAYEDDVRTLVERGVRANTSESLDNEDLTVASRSFIHERLGSLSKWVALKKPLGYQDSGHTLLVRAIVNQPELLQNGLPASTSSPKSVPWFVTNLIKAVDSRTPVSLPPFISNGIALPVMHEAIREVRTALSTDSKRNVPRILEDLLIKSINGREIMNVPWSRNAQPGPGRPPTLVVYDSWLNLGAAYSTPIVSHSIQENNTSSRHDSNAARSSIQAMSNDSRAPWAFQEVTVQNLHQVLNRSTLPIEWKIDAMTFKSEDKYVKDTYVWVKNNYDMQKPIHQTAILLAIMFSTALPDVLHGAAVPDSLTNNGSPADITTAVRNAEWTSPPKGRKGFVDRIPFVMMISTFIIAIYEPNSPLRQYMNEHKGSMGSGWTAKHGAKGVKPFNLVRIGIATAQRTKIFTSPLFNQSWALLPPSDVTEFHSDLCRNLRDLPYGPYTALVSTLGETAANRLASEQQVKGRGLTKRPPQGEPSNQPTTKKHRVL